MMTYKCCCLDDLIRSSCRMLNSTCKDQMRGTRAHTDVGCCHHRFLCIITLCPGALGSFHTLQIGREGSQGIPIMHAQNPGAFSELCIRCQQSCRRSFFLGAASL